MRDYIKKLLPTSVLKPVKMISENIPYYYRFGRTFRDTYKELDEAEHFSYKELTEYQLKQLTKIVEHCYHNVPYYRRIFDERGLKPSDIKSIQDIKIIPYLTKDIIRDNFEDLIAQNIPRKYLKLQTTGGSSGTPLAFYEDKRFAGAREWAFVSHIWKRAGFDPKKRQRFVILRGNKVQNGLMEFNGKDLILSSYHLTDRNIELYLDKIKDFNPDFIQAYPSSIEIISKYAKTNDIKVNLFNLKAIFCSSEKLFDNQRAIIEEVFNTKILNLYGQTEHCCIAGDCERGNLLHLQSEYGITELINDQELDVSENLKSGEIIATNFNNYAMPFLRYKTGDIGIYTTDKCRCGRHYPILKDIKGRETEQIITKSGAKVAMTAIIFAQHFEAFKKVKRMQLLQEEVGRVIVKIIEDEILNANDRNEIINKMNNATNGDLDITIQVVQDIPLTNRGKHKFLIQRLDV